MGYRSEVKSLVYGEPAAMAKFIADNAELIEALEADFGKDLEKFDQDKYTFLFLSSACYKWYDSYSEVKRWHNLLSLANEAELMTEFVRIGEEINDIEQDYSQTECEFYLSVDCVINANF